VTWEVVIALVFVFLCILSVWWRSSKGYKGIRHHLAVNDALDRSQSKQLDEMTKKLNKLMADKRVKKITIKRKGR